jgi:hypothetical protein
LNPDHRVTSSLLSLRRGLNTASAALATTDGRWAVVSTSLTALVAGAIAWMAMGMMPVNRPMVAPGRSSLPYALFTKLIRASEPQEAADNADNANPNPGVESRTVTLDSGDTLAGMLEDVGISAQDANAVVAAMGKNFDPRALKIGQPFDLTYSVATIDATGGQAAKPQPRTTTVMVNHKPVVVPVDAGEDDASGATEENSQPISRLLSLHFSPTIQQEITVTRTTEGTYTADLVKKELQVHRHRAGGTIDSSLYLAAMQAGIPADVVVDLIHMFSYKVDFQRDLHGGDKFEVYYDYYYTPDGQPAKYGAISYAMMTLGGKEIPMYRFQTSSDEPAEYFDDEDAGGWCAHLLRLRQPLPSYSGLHTHAQGRGFCGPHRHAGDGGGRWHYQIHGPGQRLWQFRQDSSRQRLFHRLRPPVAFCAGHARGCAGAPGPDLCL